MKRSEHIVSDASVLNGWRKSSYSGGDSGECLEVSEVYASWRKSSYSGPSEGSCLEVNDACETWQKSTYSGPGGGECLEFSDSCTMCVPVRDSKNPTGPAVVFGPAAWTSFIDGVKGGVLTR
ncbi:DUF397 domain-containing protein [Streptomyces violascens]|uniref:DUF397 domain-containing protein n=1 Tax=Streptomyces violascens TaxID=67381 RepID=A0ABQ3QNB8_9ACTN|nr:DUF397 domain-containing protein [Streptomyces violascens]GGU35225.1 hypothetical protein GCM10010289_65450 [Streptomyces violascens]GHI38779.1 hypothetical protein Sviol_31870 [Streptomyces violascens]